MSSRGGTPAWAGALGQRVRRLAFQEYALGIVVVLLFATGAILKPDTFATWDNIRNMLTQSSVVGVLAIGMTFVIATSGIDLSVGSMVAAAGVFGGIMVGDDGTSSLVFIARRSCSPRSSERATRRPSRTDGSCRSSRRSPCSRSREG